MSASALELSLIESSLGVLEESSFFRGIKSIPQIGQSPGSACCICGCMEQVQRVDVAVSCFSVCSVADGVDGLKNKPMHVPRMSPVAAMRMYFLFMVLLYFEMFVVSACISACAFAVSAHARQ